MYLSMTLLQKHDALSSIRNEETIIIIKTFKVYYCVESVPSLRLFKAEGEAHRRLAHPHEFPCNSFAGAVHLEHSTLVLLLVQLVVLPHCDAGNGQNQDTSRCHATPPLYLLHGISGGDALWRTNGIA